MLLRSLSALGLVYASCLTTGLAPDRALAQTGGASLTLQSPTGLYVVPDMNPNRERFVNYIFWKDVPDDISTLIHPPDTAGWNATGRPQGDLSVPISGGTHRGSIDRTVTFRALEPGSVGGLTPIRIRYEIVGDEEWNGNLQVGSGYTPDSPLPCVFRSDLTGQTRDLGLTLRFTSGLVDSNGTFIVGLEDFEGFHVWRGIRKSGADLSVIAELSKQEQVTGSPVDSFYFDLIIPALRATGRFEFGFPVPGLGSALDIRDIHPRGRLGADELMWFDANAFNGFTYYYGVTTFDRGYNVRSLSQGLRKFDNCQPEQGTPYACADELWSTSNRVTPQNDLQRIYAVPNPYRSGSTQFSSPNYHNFPDNKMRFVNVPTNCAIKIYTPAGDLVWEAWNGTSSGNIEWDTRNLSGEDVSSGIYVYRVETSGGASVYGRIVIIR